MEKIDIKKITVVFIVFLAIVLFADLKDKEEKTDNGNKYIDMTEIFTEEEEEVIDIDDVHTSLKVLDEGYDIFTCNGYGYRYGPSIMYYDDGSLDLWISSPGNNSTEWDYIRYMHSDDGVNWSDEKIVLRPTAGSLDHYSTCDPGVIYFGGYYYIGYTSTTNPNGYDNDIFVARSENPDGPFEKWNGSGWGGSPVPIIEFGESPEYWGVGEISFCIKDNNLYCYYSYYGDNAAQTRVCISDLSENWPANLKFMSVGIYRGSGEDSSDVAYIKEIDRFIAISIDSRLSDTSNIAIYESSDGLNFEKVDSVTEDIRLYCHSIGISKKPDGSIDVGDDLYIGYAYGDMGWGKWSACIQPIKIEGFVENN